MFSISPVFASVKIELYTEICGTWSIDSANWYRRSFKRGSRCAENGSQVTTMTWVHDQIYAGGGAYIPTHWGDFSAQTGISSVLHLCPDRPAAFNGPAPEAFEWMSIEDETQASMAQRLAAAQFIHQEVDKGRKVLLHSCLGRHRVRWAYVAYEILTGRSWRAALRSAARKPWLSPYVTDESDWQDFSAWIGRIAEFEPNRSVETPGG